MKNHVLEPAVAVEAAPSDARTRDRVARTLLEQGPSTAAALAERLGLTPAAVRRHLDGMIAEGRVAEAVERPVRGRSRGRGRPARHYALTEAGRAPFAHEYDDLATAALRFLAERAGPDAVETFARERVRSLEERYAAAVGDAVTPGERAEALARALSADGYAASTAHAGAGVQVCQHHCPVSHVAQEFPQLCEAETEVFSRLLGTHVQRLATIAHGDGVCTTHIPVVPAPTVVTPSTPSTSTPSTSTASTATTSRATASPTSPSTTPGKDSS